MIITTALAQRIVERLVPLVQQNINIMDDSGVIIGSGQPERLATCHQGAVAVLNSGRVVEIYPEEAERFPGAQPGLNWPIVLDRQIVGVVGISGHPEQVRHIAQLVKMVTELILERESLLEEFQADWQLRTQFIQLLLTGDYRENEAKLAKTAELLGVNLQQPGLVAVIHVGEWLQATASQYGAYELAVSRTRETITQLLAGSALIMPGDLWVFMDEELVVLKQFPLETAVPALHQWGEAVYQLLAAEPSCGRLRLGIGGITAQPAALRESYREAQFALDNGPGNTRVHSIYDFDMLAAYLVEAAGSFQSCLALQKLREIIAALDLAYDMRNTVNTLLDNNRNVSSTAKVLFIHRNTLVFRLGKLKELTGLCPDQSFNHALLCRVIFSK